MKKKKRKRDKWDPLVEALRGYDEKNPVRGDVLFYLVRLVFSYIVHSRRLEWLIDEIKKASSCGKNRFSGNVGTYGRSGVKYDCDHSTTALILLMIAATVKAVQSGTL